MATAADDFNRADGPLGANWTAQSGDWAVAANVAAQTLTVGAYLVTRFTGTPPDTVNHSVTAQVRNDATTAGVGVVVRASGANETYYALVGFGDVPWYIFRMVAGVETALTTFGYMATNTTYAVELEVDGTTIRARIDGGAWTSVTDTAIASGGWGILAYGSTTANRWIDGFSAADVVAVDDQPVPVSDHGGLIAGWSVSALTLVALSSRGDNSVANRANVVDAPLPAANVTPPLAGDLSGWLIGAYPLYVIQDEPAGDLTIEVLAGGVAMVGVGAVLTSAETATAPSSGAYAGQADAGAGVTATAPSSGGRAGQTTTGTSAVTTGALPNAARAGQTVTATWAGLSAGGALTFAGGQDASLAWSVLVDTGGVIAGSITPTIATSGGAVTITADQLGARAVGTLVALTIVGALAHQVGARAGQADAGAGVVTAGALPSAARTGQALPATAAVTAAAPSSGARAGQAVTGTGAGASAWSVLTVAGGQDAFLAWSVLVHAGGASAGYNTPLITSSMAAWLGSGARTPSVVMGRGAHEVGSRALLVSPRDKETIESRALIVSPRDNQEIQ